MSDAMSHGDAMSEYVTTCPDPATHPLSCQSEEGEPLPALRPTHQRRGLPLHAPGRSRYANRSCVADDEHMFKKQTDYATHTALHQAHCASLTFVVTRGTAACVATVHSCHVLATVQCQLIPRLILLVGSDARQSKAPRDVEKRLVDRMKGALA